MGYDGVSELREAMCREAHNTSRGEIDEVNPRKPMASDVDRSASVSQTVTGYGREW